MVGSVDFSDVAESAAPSVGAQLLFTQVASGDAIDRERAEADRDEIMAVMKDQLTAGAGGGFRARAKPRPAGRGRGRGQGRGHSRGPPNPAGRGARRASKPVDDDFTDADQFADSEDDDSDAGGLLPPPATKRTTTRARISHPRDLESNGESDDEDEAAGESDCEAEDESDEEYAFAGAEETVPLPKRDPSAYDDRRSTEHHRRQRASTADADTGGGVDDDREPLPTRDESPEAVQMRRQALLMRLRDLITAGYTPTRPESYFADEMRCGEDELGFEVSYGEKYVDREQWVTWMCQGLLLGFGGIHRLNKQFGPFIHTERLPARARASQSKFNGPLREIYDRHIAGSGPSNPFVKLGMAIGMVVVANHFAEEDEIRREQGIPSAAAPSAPAPATASAADVGLDPIPPASAPEPPAERPLLENIAD